MHGVMTRCIVCGGPAYIGLLVVECENRLCEHYVPPPSPEVLRRRLLTRVPDVPTWPDDERWRTGVQP